jgi:hypothetical protein
MFEFSDLCSDSDPNAQLVIASLSIAGLLRSLVITSLANDIRDGCGDRDGDCWTVVLKGLSSVDSEAASIVDASDDDEPGTSCVSIADTM